MFIHSIVVFLCRKWNMKCIYEYCIMCSLDGLTWRFEIIANGIAVYMYQYGLQYILPLSPRSILYRWWELYCILLYAHRPSAYCDCRLLACYLFWCYLPKIRFNLWVVVSCIFLLPSYLSRKLSLGTQTFISIFKTWAMVLIYSICHIMLLCIYVPSPRMQFEYVTAKSPPRGNYFQL